LGAREFPGPFFNRIDSIEQIIANGLYLGAQYALIALGLTLIFALMNVLNFAHGQMYVLGGFVTYTVYAQLGLPFFVALIVSAVTLAIVGAAIERFLFRPVIRRSVREESTMLLAAGIAFFLDAIILLAFGEKQRGVPKIVNGVLNFSTLGNVKLAYYYLAVTLMVLCYAGLYRLVHSRIGHLGRSLQQNEELASSIGVNITYLRIIAYSISSFFGGIAGATFVTISQSIYPSSFQVADSINFMLNCFLGGLGYVFGPMLGTLLLYFGWDLLFQTGRFQLLIYSSLLIALMLALPNGILSIRLFNRRKASQ